MSVDIDSGLASRMRGEVLTPVDPGYDEARRVYNAMIDRRPALIARCRDAADVIAALDHAQRAGLVVAVRGGGHNGAGMAVCDDGLVIDLSALRGVDVDPARRTVRVGGGATWGDVDHATHPFGLAVPSGIISTTGVGGLTLGGGIGHLTRRYGLTIDSLLAADVVLPDGRLVRASEDEHDDLFWAIRGGGGNFGVVTSFTFRLHPVGTVMAGPMLWAAEDAPEVMRMYRRILHDAPDALNGFFAFLTVPPGPPFPEELHLRRVCGIVWCVVADETTAGDLLSPAREMRPLLDGVGPVPFPALQAAFDSLYPHGLQWYWRADFVKELTDEAIAVHVEHGPRAPTMHSTMHLYPVDGAAGRVPADATAWAYRDARWAQVIVGVDPDPAAAPLLREWTVGYWEALHPHSMGGAYVNFLMEEGADRVRASYRHNYDRLAQVKRRYDPRNLLRRNQNIAPAGR